MALENLHLMFLYVVFCITPGRRHQASLQFLSMNYIYIYAFSRRFYPKRLTLHSSYSFTFYQLLLSLGIEPMILALLAPCSTIWATGKQLNALSESLKSLSARAVTVADFYHRGGNGPTTGGEIYNFETKYE